MPLPSGVETRTVRVAVPNDTLGQPPKVFSGTVAPNQALVWSATGERLWPIAAQLPAPADGYLEFDVPIVDQAGWVDRNGAPITGWKYRLQVTGTWEVSRRAISKYFQVLEDTVSPIEIELLPEVPLMPEDLGEPYVASLAGLSGIVTGDDLQGTLGGVFQSRVFYQPEQYGAVGDGVADDSEAIQDAIDAAHAAGGGEVLLSKRYGWTGDLIHRGAVVVRGAAARKVLVEEDDTDRGLVALDATARYFYGYWSTPDSVDDNPGGLHDLTIDGAGLGGATDGLFILQCVDGYVSNARIVNSAGAGMLFDGTQNSVVIGGLNGHHAGAGLDFSRIGDLGQGAGNVRITGMYQGSSDTLVYSSSDPTNFWPHDIYIDCLFEVYEDGQDLIHLTAGDFHFTNPLITNSTSAPTGNDCLILLENTAWPTVSTTLTLHSPILNGGGGGGVTDLIRLVNPGSHVANKVVIDGSAQWNNADNIFAIDGGGIVHSGWVSDRSEGTRLAGTLNWYRVANGGLMVNVQNRDTTPTRIELPDDAANGLRHAWAVARKGQVFNRHSVDRDGGHHWFKDDTGTSIGSATYNTGDDRMALGDLWEVYNAISHRVLANFVSGIGDNVALSAARTSAPAASLVFLFNNATANVTLTGGVDGQVFSILLFPNGTTGNAVSWPSNIKFRGAAPQPVGSSPLIVKLIKYGADWHEESGGFNSPQTTTFIGAQTNTAYAIPAGAKTLDLEVIGAGGGGGSGRVGAAGSARVGGGGGSGGGRSVRTIDLAPLRAAGVATLYVTVGSPGTGGAAVAGPDSNGTSGTSASGASAIRTSTTNNDASGLVSAAGGLFGTQGAGASQGTGGVGTNQATFSGGNGGAGNTAGSTGNGGPACPGGCPGGGGGGGITTTNIANAGGAGGIAGGGFPGAATAGTVPGGAGANGPNGAASGILAPGGGGAGGAASITGAGGAGGNGGYGAGGGGGGASLNGAASGKGGDGGVGYARITAHF